MIAAGDLARTGVRRELTQQHRTPGPDRDLTMLFGSGYLFVVWLPFFPLLHTANPVLVGLAMTLVYGGVMFMVGLLPALFAEPFPTDVRYSGSALAYTGSQLVFSAPAPLVAAIILREIGGVF